MYATDVILLGVGGEIPAGDEIPETFTDHLGNVHPVDLDRLVELGVASKEKPSDEPAGEELGEDLVAAKAENAKLSDEVTELRQRITAGEELGEDLGKERLLEIADWEGVEGVNGRTSVANLVEAIEKHRAAAEADGD